MTHSKTPTDTRRTVSWFSCGAASAVATKLTPEAVPVYCDTRSEHPDNERFLTDCERWFDREIIRISSDEYHDTWDVWTRRKYLSGIDGAPCTVALKVAPRLDFQRVDDIHIFGYTADGADVARAKRFKEHWFELDSRFPLIEAGLVKAACLELCERAGIKPPLTYGWGLPNANCLPCVKATSPDYWALIRLHVPEKFDRLAKLARELNVRLARIKDERVFIDDIPADWPTTKPLVPSCDFLCAIAEKDL